MHVNLAFAYSFYYTLYHIIINKTNMKTVCLQDCLVTQNASSGGLKKNDARNCQNSLRPLTSSILATLFATVTIVISQFHFWCF